MTKFEFLTQNPETLASAFYGLIDETESHIIETIYCATGISIDRVNLAPEIRIEMILADLLKEHEVQEVQNDTEHT